MSGSIPIADTRPRGLCAPIVVDIINDDTDEAVDCSSYECLVAAKLKADEGADDDDYVIPPTECVGGDGIVTIDLEEDAWLALEAGKRYLFEVECRLPGGKPVIKAQFVQPISGRVIVAVEDDGGGDPPPI